MKVKRSNKKFLFAFALIVLFQCAGNNALLYATISHTVVESNAANTLLQDSDSAVLHGSQIQAKDNIVFEAEEETKEEEEQQKNSSSAKYAVSHAFYTSYLDITLAPQNQFSTNNAVLSALYFPLYLQYQVFRL